MTIPKTSDKPAERSPVSCNTPRKPEIQFPEAAASERREQKKDSFVGDFLLDRTESERY